MINRLLLKIRVRTHTFKKMLRLLLPKKKLKAEVVKLTSITLEQDALVVVCIFCGKRDLYEGVASLYSFYHFSDKKYPLHWHEDGSLQPEDINYLNTVFVNIRIIRRAVADAETGSWMTALGFHFMPLLRRTLIFGVRLIDINYYAETKWVLQLDSDILFMKKPVVLLDNMKAADRGGNADWLFNLDVKSSYCTSPEQVSAIIGEPVIERFNAGVTFYKAGKTNIEYLEKVCADGLPNDAYYYWEQTLFAILMTRNKALPLPDDYDVHYRFSGVPGPGSQKVTSRHYCGDAREYFYTDFGGYVFRQLL